jgi:hypothetical protein
MEEHNYNQSLSTNKCPKIALLLVTMKNKYFPNKEYENIRTILLIVKFYAFQIICIQLFIKVAALMAVKKRRKKMGENSFTV